MSQNTEDVLVSEVGISRRQARMYLLVTTRGRMRIPTMADGLSVTEKEASDTVRELIELGAFIEYGDSEFEAMHPRFTAVNMYRRMCERRGIAFGRNKTVDNIGASLEVPYDEARGNRVAEYDTGG